MWKRDDETPAGAAPPAPARERRPAETQNPAPAPARPATRGLATIGRSVVIKGELSGSEDFQIDGTVDGTIDLSEHVLTIGPSATISAEIQAKEVVVQGKVRGNIIAVDKLRLDQQGSIEGDIVAPTVSMAEGAHFRGSIDMQPTRRDGARAKGAAAGKGQPQGKAPVSGRAAVAG